MTRSRLYELLLAYVAEKIATEELDELINYIRQAETDTDLYVVIDEIWSTLDTDKALPLSSERVYANIINDPAYRRISLPAAGRIANHSTLFRLAGFAALLCVAMALFMLLYVPKHHPLKNDDTIIPGGKKAVLTLGNGKTILLDNAFSGQIASEGKVSITQTTDGRIVYQTDDDRVFSGNRENNIMNKISTPKGGEYQIILPDGTKVWLNAASSLTYPVLFTGNKREVSIDGEAYFEVKKHTIPFIVNTKNQRIEVLGTKFNVNAYKDEVFSNTALLEGAVRINNETILKPGEQAIVNDRSNRIDVKDFSSEEILAWKNGYFTFNNADIKSVMKTIARWYDIEVTYTGAVGNVYFEGTISRFDSIEKLLKTISLTGSVKFKIVGRRVIVMA